MARLQTLIKIVIFCLITANAYATDYYVATGGGVDFTTIAQVNAQTFVAGDNIYFNRGDTWREQLVPDSGSSAGYITYSAYGTGAKPLLLGSTNESTTGDWTDETGNIWSNNDATFTVDVGNLIFDNEGSCGVKEWEEADLNAQDEFWYDEDNDLIKVYSTANPATAHTVIECALKRDIISISSTSYVIVENLDLRYGAGGLGIACLAANNIIIRDCDLSYIGGADSLGGAGTTRYGNGVQFWADCYDSIVERCTFDNIYDAAITSQGNVTTEAYNLYFRNNIITNCEYSYEFFHTPASASVHDIYFENNTCLYAGSGWGHDQRPDGANGRHLMFYNNSATTANVTVKNNIFYESTESAVKWWLIVDVSDYEIDYNCYYESAGNVAEIDQGSTTYDYATEWTDYQTDTSLDANSVASDPLMGSNYTLNNSSPCIGVGATLGNVSEDFREGSRIAPYDIGAYLYGSVIKDCVLKDCVIQ